MFYTSLTDVLLEKNIKCVSMFLCFLYFVECLHIKKYILEALKLKTQ